MKQLVKKIELLYKKEVNNLQSGKRTSHRKKI